MDRKLCDGQSRRDLIRLGAAGLFGFQWPLARLLAAKNSECNLIFLFLHGGMSTIDTFDLKPDAPAEYRGEFKPAATNVPGIQISEHLPILARQMDQFSLIRSFRHHNSDHGPADHYMVTGYFPQAGFNGGIIPNNQRPCFGSMVAGKLGPRGAVPPFVCLPKMHASFGSAFLGPANSPFIVDADPNAPLFEVPDLEPPMEIRADRLENRKSLMGKIDRFRKRGEVRANPAAGGVAAYQDKAFELMTSLATRAAFNLSAEKDSLRDEYGRNTLGQSCLLARRLVEKGVRCVMVDHSNWDTHDKNFQTLKRELLPAFDKGVAALFRDLKARGLLDNTLVVMTGEFGRTPKINANAGRDHWGPGFTVALGGGGIKGGIALGKTDAKGERPAADPYGPEDLAATICHCVGINPNDEWIMPDGRPTMIVNQGRKIEELL
ncbi:MAG: DUF1501 domain-containing protein [Gemmataceae bacterium]|nr:DUF1501 domain-containing protein [Gemmataceae bacterium]